LSKPPPPAAPLIAGARRALGPFYVPALITAVAVAVLGLGLFIRYAFYTSPDQAAVSRAPRIGDAAFEASATAVCKQYVTVFDTATTLGKSPTAAQSGAFLDSIASTFDAMVAKLSTLSVAAPDRPSVSEWLAEWRDYDAFGHQYAAAVRSGAERDLVRTDVARIDGILRQRNGFAKANHMGACAFS
jgi:hypothetical protein